METIFEIVTFLVFVTLAAILVSLATLTRKHQIPNNHLQTKDKDLKVTKDICKPLVNYQDLKRI